jgi:hypothetical protein
VRAYEPVNPFGLALLSRANEAVFFFKKRKDLKYEEFSLFSVGRKAERKRFIRYNRDMMNIGVALDGDLIAKHPGLLYGQVSTAPQVTVVPRASPWRLSPISATRRLRPISLGRSGAWQFLRSDRHDRCGPERLIEMIQRSYPCAEIEIVENRGRE